MSFRFTCTSCRRAVRFTKAFRLLALIHLCCISFSHPSLAKTGRFLVRGCLEVPVIGEQDPFVWGVWIDIGESDYQTFASAFGPCHRSHFGPFAGYLGNSLPTYPDTMNLVVVMHLRDHGIRPLVQVSSTDQSAFFRPTSWH